MVSSDVQNKILFVQRHTSIGRIRYLAEQVLRNIYTCLFCFLSGKRIRIFCAILFMTRERYSGLESGCKDGMHQVSIVTVLQARSQRKARLLATNLKRD
jgi:hypothetical protein